MRPGRRAALLSECGIAPCRPKSQKSVCSLCLSLSHTHTCTQGCCMHKETDSFILFHEGPPKLASPLLSNSWYFHFSSSLDHLPQLPPPHLKEIILPHQPFIFSSPFSPSGPSLLIAWPSLSFSYIVPTGPYMSSPLVLALAHNYETSLPGVQLESCLSGVPPASLITHHPELPMAHSRKSKPCFLALLASFALVTS